jgi:hypothetical protein
MDPYVNQKRLMNIGIKEVVIENLHILVLLIVQKEILVQHWPFSIDIFEATTTLTWHF